MIFPEGGHGAVRVDGWVHNATWLLRTGTGVPCPYNFWRRVDRLFRRIVGELFLLRVGGLLRGIAKLGYLRFGHS